MQCTLPNPVCPNVIPASAEPHNMFNPASRLPRFATNGRMFDANNSIACKLIASVIKFVCNERYDSKACTNASMPECAATCAGTVRSAKGSKIANMAGFNAACRTDILRFFSVSVITHEPDTSDPVPAVVGIAINGRGARLNLSIPS